MHMRSPTRVALLCASLIASGSLLAQSEPGTGDEEQAPRRYAVEIILFRYADSVSAGNEVFLPDPPPDVPIEPELPQPASSEVDGVPTFGDRPQSPEPPEPAAAVPAEATDREQPLEEIILPSLRIDLAVTPREELTLGETWDKLELLDAYQPVLWSGWSQSVIDRERTPYIPLRRLGNAPIGFDGELQLYLSRFLHLVVDLTLTPRQEQPRPVPAYGDRRSRFGPTGDARPGLVRLHIDEDRIVRNGDLRYFDHPKFGLLAKVTRVEDDTAEMTDTAEDGATPPATQE